jgi:glycosyltransferase involved in cell wall biosynthesis
MFSLVTIFYILQLFLAVLLVFYVKKTNRPPIIDGFEGLSIIIPFKNEFDRIDDLIESINQSAIHNKDNTLFNHLDFIFVDDHSNDNSNLKILSDLDLKFRLYKLNQTFSKKYAIKQGVELAKFNKILTLDADVKFDLDYLNNISKTTCEGLTILPVKMDGKSFIQNLFAIEFKFLQKLTFGMAGMKKYILCNGANLLFTKSTFLKSLKIRQDANILSGDDTFLLQACQQLSIPITALNHPNYNVSTNTPNNMKNLVMQRLRWIKKIKDFNSIFGALFLLSSNVLFVVSIGLSISNQLFLIPIAIKLLSEIIILDSIKDKLMVIFHQLWYPFYILILLFSLPKKNTWK